MPSRPPHPWATGSGPDSYRDDPYGRPADPAGMLFLSPSASLETVRHDDDDGDEGHGGARGPHSDGDDDQAEADDTPIIHRARARARAPGQAQVQPRYDGADAGASEMVPSRTAPLSPRPKRRQAPAPAPAADARAELDLDRDADMDMYIGMGGVLVPYSDNPEHDRLPPHAHVRRERERERASGPGADPGPGGAGQAAYGMLMTMPGAGASAPLYDPADGHTLPPAFASDRDAPGPGRDTMYAFTDPVGPAMQGNAFIPQEFCAIPYRPMEPRLRRWAKSEVQPEDVVLPLLLITFQTGVVDAATIKDFRTYTTGQTGNSILLALAVFGRRPANLLAAGLSMAGFCIFVVVFGQLGNIYGHKTRGWLLFTMSVQILLLVLNIVLVSPALAGVLPQGGPFEWAVIFTAAAQGAGQMVMAINSGVPEINTVGLTGLYAALGSDPLLFRLLSDPHVVKRNRRLWFLVIFWGGCFFGGAIATYSDMWISLIFALECKVVALGILMLSAAFEVRKDWRETVDKEEEAADKWFVD